MQIKFNADAILCFVPGAMGLSVFCWIVFHWRETCRKIDERESRKYRAVGFSEKPIAFFNIFTPVYLLIAMLFLFGASLALLIGCASVVPKP